MIFRSDIFNLNFQNAVAYLTFKKFEGVDFIRHAFSTRIGGVSTADKTSMNLSFVDDKRENVIENYHRFCDAVGVEFNSLVASSQTHDTFIREVSEKNFGTGIYKPKDVLSVDGLVTNKQGVTLATYYADCVPLFLIDKRKKSIGLAHAGWRGTCNFMAKKMVEKFQELYDSEPKDILVGIGPSIGKCCYEVDYPVAEHFLRIESIPTDKLIAKNGNKYRLDLPQINKYIFINSGVLEENISVSDVCTKCYKDLLFSHRATNGKRGTMCAVMQLVPQDI